MCAGGVQPAPVQAPDGEDRGDLPHLPLRAARHPPLPRLQHPKVTLTISGFLLRKYLAL